MIFFSQAGGRKVDWILEWYSSGKHKCSSVSAWCVKEQMFAITTSYFGYVLRAFSAAPKCPKNYECYICDLVQKYWQFKIFSYWVSDLLSNCQLQNTVYQCCNDSPTKTFYNVVYDHCCLNWIELNCVGLVGETEPDVCIRIELWTLRPTSTLLLFIGYFCLRSFTWSHVQHVL